MDGADLVAPISLSDGDDVQLGHSDGALDGSLDFLVAFPAETDVVLLVTDDGIGFEAGSLTGLGLFLDRLDFHDLFLEVAAEESIDDFVLLDGDGEPEDVNQAVDLFALDETSEFSDGFPFNLFFLSFGSLATLLVSSSAEASLFGG